MNEVPLSELAQTLAEPSAPPAAATEDPTQPLAAAAAAVSLPVVPGYTTLSELGRGGMGVVYLARQEQLKRLVALKMILSGSLAGAEEVTRFKREAESAARLSHPNIVQVYEVGEHNGLPFFSLEYVDGGSLAGKLDGAPMAPREAAALMEALAQAVHHAHQHGIIHRDLKPANILLRRKSESPNPKSETRTEGCGSGFGFEISDLEPKVTDFGLAKQLDQDSSQTRTGAIVGTPSYMAPEQARGRGSAIGTATDVYALGAILYELLGGRPPFRGATVMDTLEQVCLQEPVPLTRLQLSCPRDLETICLKCLSKETEKRYGSAEALAADLSRFLRGEPILARPVGSAERLWKWARRRPAVAALAATTLLTAVVAFGLVTWKWLESDAAKRRAEQALGAEEAARRDEATQRQRAETALGESRRSQYFTNLAFASQAWSTNDVGKSLALLGACPRDLRHWEWHYALRLCREELRTLRTGERVNCVGFSGDGKRLAAGGGGKFDGRPCAVRIYDPSRLASPILLKGHTAAITAVAFFPGGQRLASASVQVDQRAVALEKKFRFRGEVIVWDCKTGKPLLTLPEDYGNVAVSPDGRFLGSSGLDGAVRLRDAADGAVAWSSEKFDGVIGCVTFSPDGRFLAAVNTSLAADGTVASEVHIWEVRAHKLVNTFRVEQAEVSNLAFSPDGRRLAWSGSGGRAEICGVADGRTLQTLRGHIAAVGGLAFSAAGKRLATGSADRSVKVWDADSGAELGTLRGHTSDVLAVAFDPAGGAPLRLATAGAEGAVKLWDVNASPGPRKLRGHEGVVQHVHFAGDGRLASCADDGKVRVWDPRTSKLQWEVEGHAGRIAFSPDGRLLAAVASLTRPADATAVVLLDGHTGRPVRRLQGHTLGAFCVAFSPDGKTLASSSGDLTRNPAREGKVRLWDVGSGAEVFSFQPTTGMVLSLAFSSDSRRLALAGVNGTVLLWDTVLRRPERRLRGHSGRASSVAFRPDGKQLTSGDTHGSLIFWDVETGQRLRTVKAHASIVSGLAYSPDGKRLASACFDPLTSGDEVKVWDPERGQEILTLSGRMAVDFSPDGALLAAPARGSLAEVRLIHIWDGTPAGQR